jgi:hypothetical protein
MTKEALIRFWKAAAVVCVAVGVMGSFMCLPYALTTNLNFIWISGIYFIAGGILIVGGMGSYVYLLKNE